MSFELRERVKEIFEKFDLQNDEIGNLLIDLARALPIASPEREGLFWVEVGGTGCRPRKTIAKLEMTWVDESRRVKTATTIDGDIMDPDDEGVRWLNEVS